MKKLNRIDLVEMVSEEGHFSKKEARQAIDLIFDYIENVLLEGKEINVTNFGVFTPKTCRAREGTDPKKHNRILIKEKRSVTFRLSKSLKTKLNK